MKITIYEYTTTEIVVAQEIQCEDAPHLWDIKIDLYDDGKDVLSTRELQWELYQYRQKLKKIREVLDEAYS